MKGNFFKEIKQLAMEFRTCERNCINQVYAGVSCAYAVAIAEGIGRGVPARLPTNRASTVPVPDNLSSAHIMNF